MKKNTVLFVEWASFGRDFEIDLPLIYFFENVLKWEVKYLSIFNLPKILSINPDIIVMSNTTGAKENYNFSKIIFNSKISHFSHVSEGMYIENILDDFLWGWNDEKIMYQQALTLWNIPSYNMVIGAYSYLKNTTFISGSVGHDKYIIHKNENDKNYKMIIGYAAYDFNNIFYLINSGSEYMNRRFGGKNFELLNNLLSSSKEILKKLVINNPDIKFIFKTHPADGNNLSQEFKELKHFANVEIVIKESIMDIIRRSDLWMSSNSTTSLEAYVINKPTITFNTEKAIMASDVLNGSILENNYEKIQNYIEEFYNTGKIKVFEEKKELRKKLISDYIGFADGFNHIRFMSFLKPYVEKIENGELEKGKWNIPFKIKLKGYIRHFLYSLSKGKYNTPLLKRWARPYDIFDDEQVEEQKRLRYPDFDKFYAENQEQIDHIYQTWHKNWKSELGIKE